MATNDNEDSSGEDSSDSEEDASTDPGMQQQHVCLCLLISWLMIVRWNLFNHVSCTSIGDGVVYASLCLYIGRWLWLLKEMLMSF